MKPILNLRAGPATNHDAEIPKAYDLDLGYDDEKILGGSGPLAGGHRESVAATTRQ
jgi:hypothetical protein